MMNKDELIVKSNKLIESSMKFTSNEYKLITYLAAKIKKDDRQFRTFEISIQELNKFCFGISGSKTYNYMKTQYARAFASKNIIVKGKVGETIYNWFTVIDTNKRGIISICFSSELGDFLLDTKNNFTSYKLSNILELKSFYDIRIYEILKQYEKIGKREISIDNLRFMLGIEKKQYKRYRDFKYRVIEPSIESIKNKTDIKADFEELKLGRITKNIMFNIKSRQILKNSRELLDIKEKIENVLECHVNYEILERAITKYKLTKNQIDYYLDNWSTFNYKNMENKVGFLINCAIKNEPLPSKQIGSYKPEQSRNFDQREYDDEFFDSLYDNFK